MPHKTFTRGRLLSSEVQQYLMDQTVMRFATASQRATELPEPEVGMLTWLDVPGTFEHYSSREQWEPIGALRVNSKADLPKTGAVGMEAVEPSGQRWEWRAVGGTEQWTWPRAAQGTITRLDYAPVSNVALATTPGPLTALVSDLFDVPAGRRLRITWSCVTATTVAGTTYGWILQAFGAEHRRMQHLDAANVPYGFEATWDFDVDTATTGAKVTMAGGNIFGTGVVSFSSTGIDVPHSITVMDTGATTAGTDRVML